MSLKKILIIRFSSIGDIVLTTPIIRCLKKQHNCNIHYLTKFKYLELIESNPYLDKCYGIKKGISEIIVDLKKEHYDYIIDLHNNFRSFLVRSKLQRPNDIVYKESFEKWIYIQTGFNFIKSAHVVDRYFKTVKKISIINDKKGIDYFIKPIINKFPDFDGVDFSQKYIVWVLGGTYSNKRLSKEKVLEISNQIDLPIIFLGGKEQFSDGEYVSQKRFFDNTYNLCGQLTFDQSAFVIKKGKLVLTNDTGFMHISAAFQKKIISFWGCTKPSLGMYPYTSNDLSIMLISNPNKPPCSRLGKSCMYTKNGCINQLDVKNLSKIILKAF